VVSDAKTNAIFGNDNSGNFYIGNDRFIDIVHVGPLRMLRIGYGSESENIFSLSSKASPESLNFSVLSVHYNSVRVNDALVYCNGKYVANFVGESNTGVENTLSIGSILSTPSSYIPKNI